MPVRYFPHRTLIQKMIISFLISGVFMLAALMYSIVSLSSMHRMQVNIARNDLAAATTTISLHEVMLTQERLAGRYLILKQPEFRELYEKNTVKFLEGMASLRQMGQGNSFTALTTEYARYADLAGRLFAGQEVTPDVMRQAADSVKKAFEELRAEQKRSLDLKLKRSASQEARTVFIATVLAVGGVATAVVISFLMIYTFALSIGKLQRATHRIAAGDFDHDPGIPAGDEIGTLAQDFLRMAERLKELEQISLDASPLTRLPGNIAIERSLNRRLREKASFVMCYLDLDNFKSYNDRYGYIKASELIKETARLIHDAVMRINDQDAFVGHIGGDDFVAIISADKTDAACRMIINDFDAMVPAYYSAEDQAAGAINGIDRYGVPRKFPLVSISIAALACQPGDYATAAEIATAAAGVKDHVKGTTGSNFIVVRGAGLHET